MDGGIRGMRFAVTGLLLCAMAMQAHAATITVINTNDSGLGSLRQALAIANDGDAINFAVTGSITLTSGGLVIDKTVTSSGPGANHPSIDRNQGDCAFGVDSDTPAVIAGLTTRTGQTGIGKDAALTLSTRVATGNPC